MDWKMTYVELVTHENCLMKVRLRWFSADGNAD